MVTKYHYTGFTCCVSAGSLKGSDLQRHNKKYVVGLHRKKTNGYVKSQFDEPLKILAVTICV